MIIVIGKNYKIIFKFITIIKMKYKQKQKKHFLIKIIIVTLICIFGIKYLWLIKNINKSNNIHTVNNITWSIESEKNNINDINKKSIQNKNNIKVTFTWIIDFNTDDSITKFVWKDFSFTKIDYKPNDLIELTNIKNSSGNTILKINTNTNRYNNKWVYLFREIGYNDLYKMANDFYNKFSEPIIIYSAYRDYQYQLWIESWWCDPQFCAKWWHSEHQSGLAVDLRSTDNNVFSKWKYLEYHNWLKENAYKYWFHESYQKWNWSIDRYAKEPWHWRYLWIELSTLLYNNSKTFSEYYLINQINEK